jgi:hypothetical protein
MFVHRVHGIGVTVGVAALAASLFFTSGAAAETPDRDDPSALHFDVQRVTYANNGQRDARFTQLLGINDQRAIAGYHGDENTEQTPNQGFTLDLPNKFTDENFPQSMQTQVIGIDNNGDTVGFYIDQGGATHGFLKPAGADFTTIDLPGTTFNQLLGINNKGQAAGYFQDAAGLQHGYVRGSNGDFVVLNLPAPSSQATGINDHGTVVGFLQASPTDTQSSGFMLQNGKVTELKYPGAKFTQALGVDDSDVVVGFYNDADGNPQGFRYDRGRYEKIAVPGASSTIVNGINNRGDIVGFFTEVKRSDGSAGSSPDSTITNTVGFVGTPER